MSRNRWIVVGILTAALVAVIAVTIESGRDAFLVAVAALIQIAITVFLVVAFIKLWRAGHRPSAVLIATCAVLVITVDVLVVAKVRPHWRGDQQAEAAFWVAVLEALAVAVAGLLIVLVRERRVRYAAVVAVIVGITVGSVQYAGSRVNESDGSDTDFLSPFRIVAMGDSYMSGEGADRYYANTDSPGNRCHQAPTAYAKLIAFKHHWGFSFLACSGAKTSNIIDDVGRFRAQYPNDEQFEPGAVQQVAQLRLVPDPEIVLISIGGNDSGFTKLAEDCILHSCADHSRTYLTNLARNVEPVVEHAYSEVRKAAEQAVNVDSDVDEVAVFALTYPDPLGADCAAVGISQSEIAWIRSTYLPALNDTVRTAADHAGVRVIDVFGALAGHGICNRDEPAVNVITYGHGQGSILSLLLNSPDAAFTGTFHPNPYGHQLLAVPVEQAIDAYLQGDSDAPGPIGPSSDSSAPPPPPDDPVNYADPFPTNTACEGDELAKSTVIPAAAASTHVHLNDLLSRSTVCFRSPDEVWGSKTVDLAGEVDIPVDLSGGPSSTGIIIAQRPNGSWTRISILPIRRTAILSEPGSTPAPEMDQPRKPATGPSLSDRLSEPIQRGIIGSLMGFLLAIIIALAFWLRPPDVHW